VLLSGLSADRLVVATVLAAGVMNLEQEYMLEISVSNCNLDQLKMEDIDESRLGLCFR